jgi:hypothetical protein
MGASRVLPTVATLAAGWAALVAASGGVTLPLPGGVAFRSHDAWPALIVAAAALAPALVVRGRAQFQQDLGRLWPALDRAAAPLAVMIALVVLAAGIRHGAWIAGGSDAFGYVSQALGWSRGDPAFEVALAREAPWPDALATFAPLGYRPDPSGTAVVPTYPPGLPLVMAIFVRVAGARAAFLVVPACGALLVWATFVLGRRLDQPLSGLAAAALVATSPVVLFQVMQPMSDVPVSALWVVAWVLAARATPRSAFAGGLVASLATLTRPNLAPVSIVVSVVLAAWSAVGGVAGAGGRERGPRALGLPLLFLAGALPGTVAAGGLQARWYGSPLASGYGRPRDLFALSAVGPNLERYGRWLLETHGALVLLALLGWHAVWHWHHGGSSRDDRARRASTRLQLALALAGSAAVVAAYLPYYVFAEWHYLRFMMPALPVVMAGVSVALMLAVTRLPRASRALVYVVLVALLAGRSGATARTLRVFDLDAVEQRYRTTGEAVSAGVEPAAVLFSVQHGGSLRFYAHRDTLRWDLLDPSWLARAVAWLEQRGHPVYFVTEQAEESVFRDRFRGAGPLGALDWPPRIEVRASSRVFVRAVSDLARYAAGETVATERVFAR